MRTVLLACSILFAISAAFASDEIFELIGWAEIPSRPTARADLVPVRHRLQGADTAIRNRVDAPGP